jgi:threonine/homoserine/homoserine lactone efflux protein
MIRKLEGYILVGLGVALILGTAGSSFWRFILQVGGGVILSFFGYRLLRTSKKKK